MGTKHKHHNRARTRFLCVWCRGTHAHRASTQEWRARAPRIAPLPACARWREVDRVIFFVTFPSLYLYTADGRTYSLPANGTARSRARDCTHIAPVHAVVHTN